MKRILTLVMVLALFASIGLAQTQFSSNKYDLAKTTDTEKPLYQRNTLAVNGTGIDTIAPFLFANVLPKGNMILALVGGGSANVYTPGIKVKWGDADGHVIGDSIGGWKTLLAADSTLKVTSTAGDTVYISIPYDFQNYAMEKVYVLMTGTVAHDSVSGWAEFTGTKPYKAPYTAP